MKAYVLVLSFLFYLLPAGLRGQEISIEQTKYKAPLLKGKSINPVLRLKVVVKGSEPVEMSELKINLTGAVKPVPLLDLKVLETGRSSSFPALEDIAAKPLFAGVRAPVQNEIRLKGSAKLETGINYFWISINPDPGIPLSARLNININSVKIDGQVFNIDPDNYSHRFGIALRQHNQDNVHTYRIPGLATARDGSLLAIYDVRRESGRDLQGNIDIGLSRSTDKGNTWQPMQIILDMGKWGGLPEKFNGVSDANILVDRKGGDVYVAGLWMHGVINENGKWVEGLTETSQDWNHQWKKRGSQPGFDVKQSSQFLIVKSKDNGKTWSKPINITKGVKKEKWWLLAPAPGQGITLKDGTIVFPTQGRDSSGKAFSNITYSRDGGLTWKTSRQAASESTTENMVVELSDGTLMLNMRSGANKNNTGNTNGRVVAVTNDLGESWTIHPTSHNALPEPTCMASIIRHNYTQNNQRKSVLLFSNPDSKTDRKNMTIKISFDDGRSWDEKKILLDEGKSRGYSCLTSIDEETLGILYESSQADLVFQEVKLSEFFTR